MSAPAATHRPRSLTEWLRGRTDQQLAELLRRRPDLALPAPPDLATLASRLSVRTSVQRCVDGLDAFLLRVVDALLLTSPTADRPSSRAAVADLLPGVAGPELDRALDELLRDVLVWGDDAELHPVSALRDTIGPYPAGLGRPAAQLFRPVPEVLTDADRLAAELADCAPDERQVLEQLAAGPPIGRVSQAPLAASSPLGRVVERGLVIMLDVLTVELPREVGMALRAEPLGEVEPQPAAIEVVERGPAELDRVGTTAVLAILRLVEALGDAWTAQPPAQLRTGGVGVRDLRRTARELNVDESTAAVAVEIAAAAGLINVTHGVEPVYLPTERFDAWRQHDPAPRWADLTLAWLHMTRQPSLVGARGERDRVLAALGPDVERGTVPALRRQVLGTLAHLPPGHAPRERAGVLRRLAWQAPRRASGQRPAAEGILAEADLIGVTAAGGLTGYSRTLLAGTRSVAEQVLASALPVPVDHVLVQPDLTVVVPGPPTPELAAELALTADLESTGGASVYRMTESSLRRALDAGRTGTEIAAMVTQRSRTPVPQALTYLIEDLARRHGALRSGAASAYLRCDDAALLARVIADRSVADLGLQAIAPTVAISSVPVARVLERLRAAGFAPAAETPDGSVVALDQEPPRAPARAVRPVQARSARTAGGQQLSELVTRIRSGDQLSEISRRVAPIAAQVPGVTSAATMGTLREAIRGERRVLLGVAESDGTATRHELLPISMAGGFVRGLEEGASGLRAYPLHRITAVAVLADADDEDA